jgi:NAD(P)H-hydrate epimerase
MTDIVDHLPDELYTAAAVREFDHVAIAEFGIPGGILMQRAGRAAFRALLQRWPEPEHVHVFCGTGNNGGDGFVIAALARQRALPVTIWQVGSAAKIGGDALAARELALREGVPLRDFDGAAPAQGVIVDALLGSGLSGTVRAPYSAAITAINASGLPVLAVDIPSGLCSDTGNALGAAVAAAVTVTFIGLKQGLFTGSGPDCCGDILYSDLAVPAAIFERMPPGVGRLRLGSLANLLPPRPRSAHKGLFGHVLIVGGDYGMAGAAALAAQAALRVGAGLVSCATRPEHVPALVARCPELMAHGVRSGQELAPLLQRANAVVIGPGLGRSAWSEQLLQRVGESELPLVVDADALNLLSTGGVLARLHSDRWVLTPHPGEAARLLGCGTADIGRDRYGAARALQRRYGGAVVLKGAGTVVATAAGLSVSNYGNPGMATGGMGDVLSGVLGALLAQHVDCAAAAQLGVCLHGRAGDLAAAAGERGTAASDLMPFLRQLANP